VDEASRQTTPASRRWPAEAEPGVDGRPVTYRRPPLGQRASRARGEADARPRPTRPSIRTSAAPRRAWSTRHGRRLRSVSSGGAGAWRSSHSDMSPTGRTLDIFFLAFLDLRSRPAMESLLDRSLRVVRTHPQPALRVSRLCSLVRATGVAVSQDVVLQALRSGRDHVRVVDPWIGPWRLLLESRRAPSSPRVGARAGSSPPAPLDVGELWAVGHPDELERPTRDRIREAGARRAWLRMRRGVAAFGWSLDPRSARECSRWLGMVLEAERLWGLLSPEDDVSALPPRPGIPAGPSATSRPGPGRRTPTPSDPTARRRGATPPAAFR